MKFKILNKKSFPDVIGKRKVYILLTKFTDIGSKAIGLLTRCYYTHASIGFEEDMNTFYSFIYTGFKVEQVTEYNRSDRDPIPCQLYEVMVSKKKYDSMKKIVIDFMEKKQAYKYSRIGVVMGLFHIPFKYRYHYFCSQFVADVLSKGKAVKLKEDPSLYLPGDLRSLNGLSLIFQGNSQSYVNRYVVSI